MTRYAKAKDIAAFYCISQSMVYKIAREMLETPEECGVVKIGTLTRINPERFEAYLQKKGANNELQAEISDQE